MNNALNNGLLPIKVSDEFLQQIFKEVEKDPNALVSVDLKKQVVRIDATKNEQHFDINPFKKRCMIEGLSEIGFLIELKPEIEKYEKTSIIKSII